jgi:hypothetical protein
MKLREPADYQLFKTDSVPWGYTLDKANTLASWIAMFTGFMSEYEHCSDKVSTNDTIHTSSKGFWV